MVTHPAAENSSLYSLNFNSTSHSPLSIFLSHQSPCSSPSIPNYLLCILFCWLSVLTTCGWLLTDSMNLIKKIKAEIGNTDWHNAMRNLDIQKILWVYCPGHAGVKGNDRADRLAGTATITTGLRLGKSEVLRAVRQHLQQLEDNQEHHHSVARLLERDVQKGSGQ